MSGKVETTLEPRYKQVHRPLRRLVKSVLETEGADGSVAVAFVQESEMRQLNARFRGLDEPTDVLSFGRTEGEEAWPDPLRESGDDLGEVVVCPEVVHRYAAEEGGDPATQMGWTVLHGVLHLLGYDHEADSGQMREREAALMRVLDAQVRAVAKAVEG